MKLDRRSFDFETLWGQLCERCEKEAPYRLEEPGARPCGIASEASAFVDGYFDEPPDQLSLGPDRALVCSAFEEELPPERRQEREERKAAIAAGQRDLFAGA